MSTWIEPEKWYAQLPVVYAAAAALITQAGTDKLLLVKPTYRDHWAFPGGYVDADEAPHDACARELQEELGLDLRPEALLVVDWAPPAGHRPRPIMSFTFDCGTLADAAAVRLPADEIAACVFMEPATAVTRLPVNVAPRVEAALRARQRGTTAYLRGRA